MFKKWVIVGIIVFSLTINIIPSAAQLYEKSYRSSSKGWFYVGGDGSGNYTTIQAAMDNASNGDTIFVYPGIYGTLTIRKSLHFIGYDPLTTILNGSGRYDVVAFEANDVSFSSFTVQNGGTPGTGAYGRGLSIQHRTNVSVSNVILRHNYLGVMLYWDKNVILTNVSFIAPGNGIDFWDGRNCTISYCTFVQVGIYHGGFPPSEAGCSLYIHHNNFLNNSAISMGDQCGDPFGNTTIESNLFQNNSCALSISSSIGVSIIRNNFIGNTKNVALSQETFIRLYLKNSSNSQNWVENYWDDWNHNGSYPIQGKMTLDIGIPVIFHRTLVILPVPILRIRYKEYDPNPAENPYQIP
jgi:hypothetical protein